MNYEELAVIANAEGGFTYDPVADSFPTSGCAVACFKGFEKKLIKAQITHQDIAMYFEEVAGKLLAPGVCLGCWRDGDTWYLDLSRVVPNSYEAQTLMEKHNQLSYYDLDLKETVWRVLEEDMESAAPQLTLEEAVARLRAAIKLYGPCDVPDCGSEGCEAMAKALRDTENVLK